jgi:transposase
MSFHGSCNTKLFIAWPELTSGQTVVMNNALFGFAALREQKSYKIKELIETAGCKLIYLPTYFPDLNQIKKFWSNIKSWIKQYLHYIEDLHKAIPFFFENTPVLLR